MAKSFELVQELTPFLRVGLHSEPEISFDTLREIEDDPSNIYSGLRLESPERTPTDRFFQLVSQPKAELFLNLMSSFLEAKGISTDSNVASFVHFSDRSLFSEFKDYIKQLRIRFSVIDIESLSQEERTIYELMKKTNTLNIPMLLVQEMFLTYMSLTDIIKALKEQ